MSEVFGSTYAEIYDLMYEDKSYSEEAELIRRSFSHADGNVASVLDVGCGTGGHAFHLASSGIDVVGVDRSAAMLQIGRAKKTHTRRAPHFVQADIRRLPLSAQFDAAIMMFAVLCYQTTNADVLCTLRSVRGCVREGAVLVGDVWHGPAVLRIRPGERMRVFESGNRLLLKASKGQLDLSRNVCVVDVEHWLLEGGRLLARGNETHEVRYFFPQELALFLQLSGFHLLTFAAFPDAGPADDSVWNAFFVARAVTMQDGISPAHV